MKSDLLSSDSDWVIGSRRLDAILELVEGDKPLWSATELRELLQAQLELPLPAKRSWQSASEKSASPGPAIRSLLVNADTPLELLIAVKEIAKSWLRAPRALPHEIAQILYLAAITAALLYRHDRITSLSRISLRTQLGWALAQH